MHAFGGGGLASNAHQFILVDGPCRLLKIIVQALRLDDQAVVSRCGEWVIQAREDRLAVMMNLAGLAVHQSVGADDLGAESLAYTLMAEADAKDRDLTVKVTDEIATQPCVVRCARPR